MTAPVVISIVATKGGVGKTTLAANLGGLLADLGFSVLAIDADIQPSLSKYFELPAVPTAGLAEVIGRGGLVHPGDITPTAIPGLDILVSNLSDATQAWMRQREDRLIMIKRAVRQPAVRETYDFVIVDTQGARGELQRSAAMAADLMLSPLCPRVMEYAEFHSGTLEMLASLNAMADFSAELRAAPLAVVINAVDRTRNARLIIEKIRADFRVGTHVRLLETLVPDTKAYPDARLMNQPVHRTDARRGDRVQPCGYEVMHNLAFELLPNLKDLWVGGSGPGGSP